MRKRVEREERRRREGDIYRGRELGERNEYIHV